MRNVIFGKWLSKFPLTPMDKRINHFDKVFKEMARETIKERKQNLNATFENDPNRKDLL